VVSELPERDEHAGDMNEGQIDVGSPFVARHEAAEAVQPRIGAFDDPAVAVTAQLSPVLPAVPPLAAVRHDELDPARV